MVADLSREFGLVGVRGTGLTMSKPTSIGAAVPMARINRKVDVSPGENVCASRENKNAESPKPDRTRPVVVAR